METAKAWFCNSGMQSMQSFKANIKIYKKGNGRAKLFIDVFFKKCEKDVHSEST